MGKPFKAILVLSILFSVPVRADHDVSKSNKTQRPTLSFSPGKDSKEEDKTTYFDCTSQAVDKNGVKSDLGDFVLDMPEFGFWFSMEALRTTEMSDAFKSHIALTGTYKNMNPKTGKLTLTLAQNEFITSAYKLREPLAKKDFEVDATKPFELSMPGNGAVKEVKIACHPIDEKAGVNRKAVTLAEGRIHRAQFMLENPGKVFPPLASAALADRVEKDLTVATKELPEITDDGDRAKVSKAIMAVKKLQDGKGGKENP